MNKYIFLKQTGMSLVEALVGLGIAAGIGVVLMRQQENSSKMQSKNNINQIVNSAAQAIQTSLSNRAICSESLGGLSVNSNVTALVDAKINPLFPGSSTDEFIKTLPEIQHVAVNQVLPGDVKVQSMKIVVDPVNGKEYLSVVFDTDPKRVKQKFGANTIGKQFQIQTMKNGAGVILSCYSEQTNLLDSAVSQACTSMGASWDPATKKCKLTNLPNCIVSNEACRGAFAVNRGEWKMDIKVYGRKKCTQEYKREAFTCGGKYFYRDCWCGGSTGVGCNCDTGRVGCYSRTTMTCVDDPEKQEVGVNRCCQI